MDYENFTLQSSLEANYLNIRLQEPVQLDEIAIRVVQEDCPEFLIPFRIVNINESISLKYKLVNTIALKYSNMTLRKTEFVRLYQKLLTPFIKGNDWFLDYHNFCIDPQYIFLDKLANAVYFIYVPESSCRNRDEEILQFFQDTFVQMTITDDANFQVRLYQYFSRRTVTLADLYSLIQEESRRMGGGEAETVVAQGGVIGTAPGGERTGAISGHRMEQSASMQSSGPSSGAALQEESGAQNQAEKGRFAVGWFGDRSAKDSGKKKSDRDISGGKKEEQPALEDAYNDPFEDSDEVVKALFSGKNKKDRAGKDKTNRDKNKKDKVEKDKTGKEKAGRDKDKADRTGSGGFGLFGRKKEQGVQKAAEQSSYVVQDSAAVQEKQTGFLGWEKEMPGNTAQRNSGQDVTYVSATGGADEGTEIVSDFFQAAAYLELITSAIPDAPPRIDLDFQGGYITIGRMSSDEVQPDVAFGREFSRIGRRHARIEKREGNYFVVDLGSANHTLLNGQILVPNQPYQLQEGGELTFTDSKPVRYRVHL